MASMRVALTAMIALSPGLLGAAAQPEPEDELPGFEDAAMVSGLSVMVERPDERLLEDQDTTYTIAVGNRAEDPAEVTIRVTVPPWMSEADPHDGGELGEGFVDWPVTVAPGEVTIMRMSGAYASPERDRPTRVAFTACALDAGEDEPIVCGTDVAQLESDSSDTSWAPIAGSAAAVAAVAGIGLLWWGRRRRRSAEPAPPPEAPTAESREPLADAAPEPEPGEPVTVTVSAEDCESRPPDESADPPK